MPESPASPLWIAAFLALAACAAPPPASSPPPAPPRPPPAPRELWPRFAEVAGWAPIGSEPARTQGHLVKQEYFVVRASPEAREPYLGLVTDSALPDGSTVAIFHQDHTGSERGPVYVMEKDQGRWRYLVLDPGGFLIRTDLRPCETCHAGGVADHLFGRPHPPTDPSHSPTDPSH